MKTEQIVLLDYREEENKILIQKVLRQVKPLSKYSMDCEIPLTMLEKTVSVLTQKYSMQPQWITCLFTDLSEGTNAMYSCSIKTSDTHEWLDTVSAHEMYELFAKVVILMYSQVRQGKVRLRDKKAEQIEREKLAKIIERDGGWNED